MAVPIDSPFVLVTRLVTDVGGLVVAFDIDSLDRGQQREIVLIKRVLADARLDIRDYELSETRAEQIDKAELARKRLEELRHLILRSSEYGVFGAIDVAHTSAQIDAITMLLQ